MSHSHICVSGYNQLEGQLFLGNTAPLCSLRVEDEIEGWGISVSSSSLASDLTTTGKDWDRDLSKKGNKEIRHLNK